MVWNPARDFMQGLQMGQVARDRERRIEEQERKRREREELRDAWGAIAQNEFGLEASPDDIANAFDGRLPDAAEVVAEDVEDSFGEGYSFAGFESAGDGQSSSIRITGPDGEEQLIGADTEEGRELITLPNDQSTGMPGARAIQTIMRYNPEAGLRLVERMRNRRRAEAERNLMVDRLEMQHGGAPAASGQRRGREPVRQTQGPSLSAAQRMDGMERRSAPLSLSDAQSTRSGQGATAYPAEPQPEAAQGAPLMDSDRAAFVQSVYPDAKRVADQFDVPVEAVIAQAAHESNFGASAPGNNYFGIKAPAGEGQGLRTAEYVDGERQEVTDNFRTYDSPGESFDDLGSVLSLDRYAGARGSQSVEEYARALQEGGYATDPEYANRVATIADSIRSGMTLPKSGQRSDASRTLPPREVLDRVGRDLGQATPADIGEKTGQALRATGSTLADWAGDTMDLWNEYGQPVVDNSVSAYRGLGEGLVRGLKDEEAPEPDRQDAEQQPESTNGGTDSGSEPGNRRSQFSFNSGEAQGIPTFEPPAPREVDRTRARATRSARSGRSSREFASKVIDSLRRGEISSEFAQEMLDTGGNYKVKSEDGRLVAYNEDNPRDNYYLNEEQAEALSAKERFDRSRDVLDSVAARFDDNAEMAAMARSRALVSQSAGVLDLTDPASEALVYQAQNFTENMRKDAGWLWFDESRGAYASYTPAIIAMKAGYRPDQATQAVEETLNPIRNAAGRDLSERELRMAGDVIAQHVAANPNIEPAEAAADFSRLIQQQGFDSVMRQLGAE